jgi:N-methylhydantoinase A
MASTSRTGAPLRRPRSLRLAHRPALERRTVHRVAIDIGGTFTDLAAVDEETGSLVVSKASTTPGRLDDGVMSALERSGVPPASVGVLVHGTTVVINAITERRGAATALVTTQGFRDVLEIGRANRPDLYNLSYAKPVPFVPRRLRFEVTERMSYKGTALTPLDEGSLERLAGAIRSAGVRAVAVCFLHAWANPSHERRAAEILAGLLPGVEIVASHEVSGQWREYERTSTTVLSAYVKPVVAAYLGALGDRLDAAGAAGPRYAVRSGGGVASFERAMRAPINLLESGPVAGVLAAAEAGRRLGTGNVLALDVGGTTAKTSAVLDGRLRIETLHHVGRTPSFAGYPVQAPVVEIVEIGAGGGSIAWVDEAGGLHVGPRSAGAEPGPACYGLGGDEATLTDANLVAGRLDPAYFLGGSMRIDPDAAHRALERIGGRLGVGARDAARGVLRFAIAQMAHALRLVSVRRGHDPRDFTFIAYGGAGPLHAAPLARELGIGRVVVPPAPGNFSAFGMLLSEIRSDAVRTHVGPLDASALAPLFAELEKEATAGIEEPSGDLVVHRFAELRYVGQEHGLELPLPDGPIDDDAMTRVREEFDARSREAYAFSLTVPVEIVSARVSVGAPAVPVRWDMDATASGHAFAPRTVDVDVHGGERTAEVLERAALEAGRPVAGPCVIEEPTSTTIVLPGQRVRADELGNLVIEEATA